jgi:hypothetical protein
MLSKLRNDGSVSKFAFNFNLRHYTTGERLHPAPLLVESRETSWVNLNSMLRILKRGDKAGDFLWASEKTGFAHLYLHCGKTGRCLRVGPGRLCSPRHRMLFDSRNEVANMKKCLKL